MSPEDTTLDLPQIAKALRILAQLAHDVNCALQDAATDFELLLPDEDDGPAVPRVAVEKELLLPDEDDGTAVPRVCTVCEITHVP